jgi:glucokinase
MVQCNTNTGPYRSERTHLVKLRNSDYADLASLLTAYIEVTGQQPQKACLAVAGSVVGDLASVTPLNWYFSLRETCSIFGFSELHVINDLVALAHVTPYLPAHSVNVVRKRTQHRSGPLVAMGVGTGFGVAALVSTPDGYKALPSAGGHTSFSPQDDIEACIQQALASKQSHVAIEHVLSGRGLEAIYHVLSAEAGLTTPHKTAKQIIDGAVHSGDPLAKLSARTFWNVLGSVAGDKALSFCAHGGAFIGGGIVQKLSPLLSESQFIERFNNKGVMKDYASHIPISLITDDNAALTGAAIWYGLKYGEKNC